MSIIPLNGKLEPQPWMAYQNAERITHNGQCCPYVITDPASLLPFQIISAGTFVSAEITPYGQNAWSVIDVSVTTDLIQTYNFISYNGTPLISDLDCGVYEFRVTTTTETWYFEPFMVEDFEFNICDATRRDYIWCVLRFSDIEHWYDGRITVDVSGPIPFMHATENPTTGSATVYVYDCDLVETELVGFPLDIEIINGLTCYIYDGTPYAIPENDCGTYRLKIVDGDNEYCSVPFQICEVE